MSERVEISKRLVLVNTASALATRLLSISILIWLQQYLLKRITPEEYSLLPVLYSVMMFAPLIIIGLAGGLGRYILDAYAKDDDEHITQIVSTMFPILCAAGAVLLAAGTTFAWYIDWVFKIAPEHLWDARIMMILLMFAAAVRLAMSAFGSGLFVRQRFVLQNVIELCVEIFRVSLLLILLFSISTRVIWVIVASVSADLLGVVIINAVSRRIVPAQRFKYSRIHWPIARKLTSFGGWGAVNSFSRTIRMAAAPIILNRLASPLDVACFHLGSLVPNRLEMIISLSFGRAVSPPLIAMHSLGQHNRLKNAYLRLGRLMLWGLLLVIAPLLVHYKQLVILYVGDTYLSAGTVMFLLLALYPIVYGNILHQVLASAKVRMYSLSMKNSIASVSNLFLTLLLVGYYHMGALGAALGTFITYGLTSMLLLWPFGKRMAGATWLEVLREILLPGLLPFLASCILMKALVEVFPPDSWLALGVNASLGSCAYLVVLWFVMTDVDKRQFKEVVGNLLAMSRRVTG